MASPVKRRYPFPAGYRTYSQPSGYKPWNNAANSASPARTLLGATQLYNIASVPADLSTFVLNAPNGQSYTFQFVYNASVQTLGIKIPLPLSGASTAAQVQTAIAGVLVLAGGTTIGGTFVSFPWTYATTGAAQFRINWTVAGATALATGTQVTITAGAVAQSVFAFSAVVPATIGRNFDFLHGV